MRSGERENVQMPWRASRRQLVDESSAFMTDVVGDVDLKRAPCCCSPALAPLCLQHVGRATFSLTHRPAFFLLLPIASGLLRNHLMHIECETAGTLMGRVCVLCHEILHCLRCGRFQRSREKDVWVQGLLAQPSPHVGRVRVL